MKLDIRRVLTDKEMDQAFNIRRKVFIIGQNVPEDIEMDEFDESAHHVLAFADGVAVGTARWRFTEEDAIKLERFAVLDAYQSIGIGSALVRFILGEIDNEIPVYLNAQESVISFYEQFGFSSVGGIFFEANIPHKKMILKRDLKNQPTI
jgi:predicted GNAT family N-acyltransferase